MAEVDRIIGEMHEDGTLTALSEKWYDGLDLTVTTPVGDFARRARGRPDGRPRLL